MDSMVERDRVGSRPAFSRLRSFMWFATAVAGLTVRTELLGVISIVRALTLRPRPYNKLLDSFHSSAVQLDRLSGLWAQAVLRLFPHPLRVNGRRVLVRDGIKVPKRGKKMPGVKLLHQHSDSNTKPEYLAVAFPKLVWESFGSWLRTIRPGIPPSEFVVANALRQSLPEFLLTAAQRNSLAKFIVERQDPRKMEMFRLAA